MALDRILALPCWQGDVTAEPLAGGLSNEIWKVTDAVGPHVLRFGVDYPFHHVNRAREAMVSRAAHACSFAPAVEYTTPGVMVTEFVQARTWDAKDVAQNPARIAIFLRSFHQKMPLVVSGEASLFWVFHVIRDYARTLNGSVYSRFLPEFTALSAVLETVQVPLPIIFSHNDLLPANILDDGARLWLIDYEYAGFSTPLFDLANAASNAGMTQKQALTLLNTYFETPAEPPLLRAFEAMKVAALLRETMWAMVSDLHLSAPGVDYAAYLSENQSRLVAQIDAYQALYGKLLP
ncbi:choline kinase family protein [Pseudorhodobacter wandonensis]|uniref:choline kinase family protein n=1 Tax=Pseudorhodobacter wandonensis TaxID=1120568 RepID=UPI00067D04E1|nr:choline kinase family protein [Pseudorhodobacter wandonensis]